MVFSPPPRQAGDQGGAQSPREILLVDPSLFAAPYDSALSGGLRAAGANPRWATRGLREGEEDLLGQSQSRRFFYPRSDGPRRGAGRSSQLLKGVEHALGMRKLLALLDRERTDLVHFQWLLLPAIDRAAIRRIRRRCPVVVTVHDTEPFNGKAVKAPQRAGLAAALRSADRIIVHTGHGKHKLGELGIDAERISIVPHGLLGDARAPSTRQHVGRWHVVLMGKLQHYKGVDVLIEALGRLNTATCDRLRVTVAGEPLIPTAMLVDRARALGLTPDLFDLRPGRLSEAEMEDLIDSADAFVFPYRAIEASGVLFLVASAGRWIIASDLGAFSEMLEDGATGTLVPPGDAAALAGAIEKSIGRSPKRDLAASVPGWTRIGEMTRQAYRDAAASWRLERERAW